MTCLVMHVCKNETPILPSMGLRHIESNVATSDFIQPLSPLTRPATFTDISAAKPRKSDLLVKTDPEMYQIKGEADHTMIVGPRTQLSEQEVDSRLARR